MEYDPRRVHPFEIIDRINRTWGKESRRKEMTSEPRWEAFMGMTELNMVVQSLSRDEKALQVALTTVVRAFVDTGKIPSITPINRSETKEPIK